MRQGTLRANAIAISELSYDFIHARLAVTAMYVNADDGMTLGMIPERAIMPSERSRAALEELARALEEDLSATYMTESADTDAHQGSDAVDRQAPTGIGEALGLIDTHETASFDTESL